MTRTDVHRPAVLVTEDYEYLYCFDAQAPGHLVGVDMDWWRSITNFDPAMRDRGMSQCHHCGAYIRYVALLRHVPSGYAIAVGETCLENRFERATTDFQRLRRAAELDRKEQRIKTLATEAIANISNAAVQELLVKDADLTQIGFSAWALEVFTDIRRKLWMYGDLSPKQAALLVRLVEEIPSRQEREAAREVEINVPAPTGRVTFTGEVIKTQWRENDFGGCMKLTIKVTTDAGVYLVWVSEPAAIEANKGDIVTMTATLSRGDSEHFAFGKRPAKASIVEAAADR